MAEVLLFHHVLGLTPGVLAFADSLRAGGHTVHVPDLFGGQTFASIDDGARYAAEIGIATFIDAGVASAEGRPADLVYAGISLGVLPAQRLAQTRPGAAGAVLIEGCAPPDELGEGWPDGLAVQIHGMDADPFFAGEGDLDTARRLVTTTAETARAELFVYPGDAHLFTDASLESSDPEATALVLERVLAFLTSVS